MTTTNKIFAEEFKSPVSFKPNKAVSVTSALAAVIFGHPVNVLSAVSIPAEVWLLHPHLRLN